MGLGYGLARLADVCGGEEGAGAYVLVAFGEFDVKVDGGGDEVDVGFNSVGDGVGGAGDVGLAGFVLEDAVLSLDCIGYGELGEFRAGKKERKVLTEVLELSDGHIENDRALSVVVFYALGLKTGVPEPFLDDLDGLLAGCEEVCDLLRGVMLAVFGRVGVGDLHEELLRAFEVALLEVDADGEETSLVEAIAPGPAGGQDGARFVDGKRVEAARRRRARGDEESGGEKERQDAHPADNKKRVLLSEREKERDEERERVIFARSYTAVPPLKPCAHEVTNEIQVCACVVTFQYCDISAGADTGRNLNEL